MLKFHKSDGIYLYYTTEDEKYIRFHLKNKTYEYFNINEWVKLEKDGIQK